MHPSMSIDNGASKMLGRLLNTAASAFNSNPHSPRNPTQLESVTEEEHTSGLLFPDVSVLQRSRTHTYPLQISALSPNAAAASSFDDKGGLDLDETKDFRIIIAQNAMGDRDEPCVLLDTLNLLGAETPSRSSQGSPLAETPRGRHSRTSSSSQNGRRHAVHGSQSSIPDLIPNPPFTDSRTRDVGNMSVFLRARNRRSTFSTTTGEDYHQNRLSGDSGDSGLLTVYLEAAPLVSCVIYQNAHSPCCEISIRNRKPFSQRRPHHQRARPLVPHRSPKGLSRELSVADQGSFIRNKDNSSISETQGLTAEPPEPQLSSFAKLFSYNDSAHYKKRKIKEKKTPMYAVAIAVQLPVAIRNHGRQYSPCGQDTLKPPGLISTSLDSDKRWHFASEDGSTYLSAASNLDERIDTLVDYWDIITRMLSHLEKVASKEILSLLKEADLLTIQRPKPIKQPPNMQRTNQTMIHLPPNSLAGNVALQQETLRAIHRVSLALKIPRVVTGQSRWGVWRDEARWIAKFLTFLGNHTDWLGSLGPEWHKRRHILHQRAQQDSELSIPNRTVIISPCKMTARRLIFVLSAFLPAQQRPDTLSSPLRPSTSASLRQTSQSPPNPQFFRRESLRRTLNRRARTRNFVDEQENFKRSASVSSNETTNALADDLEFMSISARQIRRDSDVRSVKTASLPIPANSMSMRKSSTAIAAPAVPGTATPVPHFASQRGPRQRGTTAGQSENVSAASANLMQTLRRSESSNAGSTGSDYPTPSRWGSLLSNFWSSRETSSTAKTDAPPSLRRDETDSSISPSQTANSPVSTLVKMAGETDNDSSGNIGSGDNSDLPGTSIPHTDSTEVTTELSPEEQDICDETPASPVKLCVEASDGVVDVEVPLPGFLSLSSSNDSTMASPRKTRTSITSIDGGASFQTDNYPCPTTQRDYERLNLNVAGWLSRYHEDFVLQAVRPYPTLEADVRRSMSAEPTPTHLLATMTTVLNASGCSEKWVDICSTLIADTTSSTVKRLRLRRKISSTKSGSGPLSPTITSSGRKTSFSAPSSASDPGMSSPIETRFIEEEFIEEPVMDLDGTLVDAVERVLAQSGPPSANHSRTASPNRGRRGRPGPSQLGDRQTHDASNTSEVPTFEVPRNECRRMVLGALEEVVRSVAAEYRREESSTKLDNADIKGSSRTARKGIGTIADNTLREGIRRWLMDIEETC
ncbi:hypothetical protein CISG_08692 [Coccidioides immitis RMSCC 3703]|uniref:Folliculin-interacting protein N-terminal domain-containing protein n=1 Tax=Coccidioides immitis RMSCC 3703 TaxID=454286 RepID=A0A0J8R6U8_COCIT|nr:hypothetical protein CISG_08692 [Coccidioides immitis RMSCC 3703]